MNNKAIYFIFITLVIDCTGIGIIIPIVPKLIQELTGGNISQASKYGGWLMFTYALMQFIFAPVLGGLSDKFGRRPILLTSLFGLGTDYLFLAIAPNIFWLFLGRLFAGICGASFSTASAYIADVSPPEKRAQNFGMIGAAFGLGFIIGPLLGSIFSQWGVRIPFVVAASFSLINFLYGYFILPESLKKENRRTFEWKRANPLGATIHLQRYNKIIGLLISLVLLYIAGKATESTWTYYTMERFGWNEAWVGYSIAFVGLVMAIVQGGLIRLIIPKIGQRKSVFIGILFYIIGFVLFAFANQGWMMFAFTIPYALGGITGPAIQGIMSAEVPANEQGELQGAVTSLMSLTSIVGPLLMTNLFYYFTKPYTILYLPGAPFLMGGVLTSLSALICYRYLKRTRIKVRNEL